MKIVWLDIVNFRSVRRATLYPDTHNVFLGPNNVGKTTILEALNLLLNPETGSYTQVIDENDFYRRRYRAEPLTNASTPEPEIAPSSAVAADALIVVPAVDAALAEDATEAVPMAVAPDPILRIEAVLADLTNDDLDEFPAGVLVPWDVNARRVVESTEEGQDPFASAVLAVRLCFEGWYDMDEDSFDWKTYFRADPSTPREMCTPFTRAHKRRIGFLIYRDFRALQRAITLEPYTLFGRLLESQNATPKNFESVLSELEGVGGPLFGEPEFARVINEYRQELLRYLPLATVGEGHLSIEATDRTREEVKAAMQLYVKDHIALPLQKMGAGTRSLAILAILLLIARKRGRGIIALEEPETFLFPHAQRRVIDEVIALASQTFVTTHSPYVLERLPVAAMQRLARSADGDVDATAVVDDQRMARHIRERFRRQLSEALLGNDAIVVEEETTRLWLLKASALWHGRERNGERMEALELQGIAVVTSQGNGDIKNVCPLLARAGLRTFAFLDQVNDATLGDYVTALGEIPMLFHAKKGLEELLLAELPRDIIRSALINGQHAKHNYPEATVDSWTSAEFSDRAFKFLENNKHIPFHEWLIDQVEFNSVPKTFLNSVAWITDACAGRETLGTCSLPISV